MSSLCLSATRQISRTRGAVAVTAFCQRPNLSHRQVTVEEATNKATQMNIMFMETSAKAGHNVKSLFKKIAMSLPGMDGKDSTNEGNTSESLKLHNGTQRSRSIAEIDVSTPANAEMPEASACNC